MEMDKGFSMASRGWERARMAAWDEQWAQNGCMGMENGPGMTRKGEPMVPGRDVVVVRLQDADGKISNAKDVSSALLKAFKDKPHHQVQEMLSANDGINLEATDEDGNTLLALAAEAGQLEVVKDLAARNANSAAES